MVEALEWIEKIGYDPTPVVDELKEYHLDLAISVGDAVKEISDFYRAIRQQGGNGWKNATLIRQTYERVLQKILPAALRTQVTKEAIALLGGAYLPYDTFKATLADDPQRAMELIFQLTPRIEQNIALLEEKTMAAEVFERFANDPNFSQYQQEFGNEWGSEERFDRDLLGGILRESLASSRKGLEDLILVR